MNGFSTGPARNSLHNAASDLLVSYGIEWSPNKIINAVKKYEKTGHRQTLRQFLAQQIARENTNHHPTQNATGYVRLGGKRRRQHSDPTGNTAVRNVHQEQAMSKQYVPLKVAAETVGVSVSSLRRYIAEGRITAHRVGPKLIRVDLAQVETQLFGEVGGDAA